MQETKERQGLVLLWALRFFLFLLVSGLVCGGMCLTTQATAGGDSRPRQVIPLGQTVGIKLFSDGVLVVGLSDIPTEGGLASPAKSCGLREGDVITHINNAEVNSIEDVQTILQDLSGQDMSLRVQRAEKTQEVTTHGVQCSADGAYKLGAWIRDSMAGIGTLTFADPDTGLFATLGHGINDVDTSVLMGLEYGSITPASVAGVVKGVDGRPGELRGAFTSGQDLGVLFANTKSGVFGTLSSPTLLQGCPIPVATEQEVHTGPATILSNVSGQRVAEYQIEILKVYNGSDDSRDLMLKVTDPALLAQTGGIVQGMSGSPILQDGKLVGAVTHVLIDHADQGYGILATHMLEAAEK